LQRASYQRRGRLGRFRHPRQACVLSQQPSRHRPIPPVPVYAGRGLEVPVLETGVDTATAPGIVSLADISGHDASGSAVATGVPWRRAVSCAPGWRRGMTAADHLTPLTEASY